VPARISGNGSALPRRMKPMSPIVRQTLGWALIGAGVVGMLVPMAPGLLFVAVGALLLARHVRAFRRLSAWFHKRFPNLRGPMRRFRPFKRRRARYIPLDSNSVSAENGLAKSASAPQSDAEKQTHTLYNPR
jgi:hypothetical protein